MMYVIGSICIMAVAVIAYVLWTMYARNQQIAADEQDDRVFYTAMGDAQRKRAEENDRRKSPPWYPD